MDYSKVRATWWTGTCYHREQLDALIGLTDVKAYAYILHDKDIAPETGEPKKAHWHFLVQLNTNQRGSWFKMFSSDDMGLMFAQPCYSPEGAYNYLIHDTPSARKQHKYLYDPSERISTIETLEPVEVEDENLALYNDLMELIDGSITWREMIHRKPKRIHMISNIKTAYDLLLVEQNVIDRWKSNAKTEGEL